MRVIICGSRAWTDVAAIGRFIEELPKGSIVVHGDCSSGADAIADSMAWAFSVTVEPFPADWRAHGRSAGPIRNQVMLAAGADLVAAFWDGSSRGTAHMVAIAKAAGVPVRVFMRQAGDWPPPEEMGVPDPQTPPKEGNR